jgi:hypothetical protein
MGSKTRLNTHITLNFEGISHKCGASIRQASSSGVSRDDLLTPSCDISFILLNFITAKAYLFHARTDHRIIERRLRIRLLSRSFVQSSAPPRIFVLGLNKSCCTT